MRLRTRLIKSVLAQSVSAWLAHNASSMGATSVFGELQHALDTIWGTPGRARGSGWLKRLRARLLSFGMTVVLFAMIYKYIPRENIGWRDLWIGAAVTAFLFAIGKSLIGLYLGRSSFSGAYGAAYSSGSHVTLSGTMHATSH